ncbi:relaxase/mobilization nuclease domain-containing protein [Ruminococcaceae bacterium OttesenSCG-928-L11]|nr:relaxase/mobilization nuclease domain-containing protein [Ruminococcaceae bacterium OttesenSCG-928-L11]
MATTRLMPLHTGKGRSVAEALGRSTDYVENPDKTDGGEWVSAYECDPMTADAEFLYSKRQYAALTGRDQGGRDVIAYHLRQSFKPEETDPATANKIGYELAMALTKGKHAFIVCTHVDKAHVHSHIIFNSTSLDHSRKFKNFWNSSFAIRKISDRLCLEHGLSVIENPKPSRGSYGTWLGDAKQPTQRDKLRQLIDVSLSSCASFDEFLAAMKAAGCEVKRGKHLAFKAPGQQRFIRCDSLGDDYTEDAIRERLSGKRVVALKSKPAVAAVSTEKPNLLIDIQAKLQQAYSPGFERFAKLFNLKEMAKTLIYLQEHGLTDYDALAAAASAASKEYHGLVDQSKANSARMEEIATLQKHIGAYRKTKDVYRQYVQGGRDADFYEAHRADIMHCEEAKKHFDACGYGKGVKIPSMDMLKKEYATLASENRKLAPRYKQARQNMMELLTAKSNADRILGVSMEQQKHRQPEQDYAL